MIQDPVTTDVPETRASSDAEELVIPLISEQLVVSKRNVETGIVRLTKHTEERTETLDIPLTQVRWEVEHVPVDKVVTEPPGVRYEGDTTIYPVVAERLVVRRELVLVEEVRITRSTSTTQETTSYVLRSDAISEERIPTPAGNLIEEAP